VRSFLSGRFSLAALLAVATLLFAIGVTAERSSSTERVPAESSGEEVAGVDLESTPSMVLAVLAGPALSATAASDLGRRRTFLLVVVAIALGWAVLDVRELLHQLDESRGGIAAIALAVAVLHLSLRHYARVVQANLK
jgi:hypothetical protein